jgi:hypothetical protein
MVEIYQAQAGGGQLRKTEDTSNLPRKQTEPCHIGKVNNSL